MMVWYIFTAVDGVTEELRVRRDFSVSKTVKKREKVSLLKICADFVVYVHEALETEQISSLGVG